MNSLWDLLPDDIQLDIREFASASYIQDQYRKNRVWYFLRERAIKKLSPNYTGKRNRSGDRVAIIFKSGRIRYGTVTSISYLYKYYCRITLQTGKRIYYYKKNKYQYNHEVINIILLKPWQYCRCDICKQCDLCLLSIP